MPAKNAGKKPRENEHDIGRARAAICPALPALSSSGAERHSPIRSLGTTSLLVMTASGTGSAWCVRCWRVNDFLAGSSRWRLGPGAWEPGALASSGYGQGAGARARPHGL